METTEIIDLYSFNELWDEDGDAVFESNLFNVFMFFLKEKLIDNKKQQYCFYVSKISYKGKISRYLKERNGTIKKFLNYWLITFKEPFSKESFEKFQEKRNFEMEMFEKEAERKAAWGMYGSIIRAQNERKEYQEAYSLSPDKREKELNRLKGRSNSLIIGG